MEHNNDIAQNKRKKSKYAKKIARRRNYASAHGYETSGYGKEGSLPPPWPVMGMGAAMLSRLRPEVVGLDKEGK